MQSDSPDLAAIDQVVARFFAAFDNRHGRRIDMAALRALLLPDARIVKTDGAGGAEVMDPDAFIAPREALLLDGALTEFHEWETQATTTVFGGAAIRRCTYRKAGLHKGAPYEGAGFKAMSLAKSGGAWRIASVLWQDEVGGLSVADLVF